MTPSAPMAALRFQIGARTLLSIPRRLRRVSLSLDAALAGSTPPLPALDAHEHGWLLTSAPAGYRPPPGALALCRQRYTRHHLDLAAGEAAWMAGLSGSARQGLNRKRRKLATRGYRVTRHHDAAGFAAFFPQARAISARTYQERLLGSGLPADPAALARLAATDGLRAWLLHADDAPVAYLCCTAEGATLRYDHVGHDPAWNDWSPGAVLQADALAELFADRFARFDFTEGEGQHKRQFASGGVACADWLLLRPTPANRAALGALATWDRAVERAKGSPTLRRLGERLRR